MIRRTIEEELALNGHGLFHTVGNSMEPLLHNRKSIVAIEATHVPSKKDDVALYRRPNGEYVLHRVMKVLNGAYLIRGDNCSWQEKVPEEWVIGVMTGYFEKGKDEYVSCESGRYRRYLNTLEMRRGIRRLRMLLKRIKRKLFPQRPRKRPGELPDGER